ncbi:MAG TPA: PQQ-dependent sugar dehydrogenase, partial [Cyclobacteriaceae bacterium]|nr:PQQ-dependent sugar dehydrogenase [Cyclobacteriaceae bacterium]
MKYTFVLLSVLTCLASCNPEKKTVLIPNEGNGGITLPEKFGAVVVVDTLGRGRHMAINKNGDIYLHLARLNGEGKGIIVLRDTTGDGRADIIKGYNNTPGTGIELHNGYLYYSDRTHVYRSKLNEGDMLPAEARDTVVTLVDGGGHMEKPFTFDDKGGLYVNVGSLSNDCEMILRTADSKGDDPCKELETRAGIWKFDDNTLGQTQDIGHRWATGIRNAVALTWSPENDRVYAVQHGRDDLHRYWPALYTEEQNTELPSEIFFDLKEGDDMGWPYCYYDHQQGKKLMNPEYGGDGVKADRCVNAKDPLVGFPGHWAPNDVLIYKGNLFPEKYKGGAFIAFHGSWNRLGHAQQGYKVVFVPMKDGKPSGQWEVFADGFIGQPAITNPGNAFFRPCGLSEGPDGSLYISDSQHGRIWRITYFKDEMPKPLAISLFQPIPLENPDPVPNELLAGKRVYDKYCIQCHMNNGAGAPGMNPPLSGVEFVTGDKK